MGVTGRRSTTPPSALQSEPEYGRLGLLWIACVKTRGVLSGLFLLLQVLESSRVES